MTDSNPDPVYVAPNVEVTDAYVDFTGASKNELYVETNTTPSVSSALPVAADEPSDRMLVENDAGLFWGFNDGPVQPPADTSPKTATTEIVHEELGTIERVMLFDHITKRKQNDREPESVLSVHYKPDDGYTTAIPTRVRTAQRIVDRYINGPLGGDINTYWYIRKQGMWGTGPEYDDYKEYDNKEIVLATNRIYTWKAYPTDAVPEGEDVYVGTEPAKELEPKTKRVATRY